MPFEDHIVMLRIVAKSASLCQMAALSAALLLVPPQASAENEKSNDFMVQYDQVRLTNEGNAEKHLLSRTLS